MDMRKDQLAAAAMLSREIEKGGVINLNAPIGYGKTIVIVEAIRSFEGRVAHVSKIRELLLQFEDIAKKIGVTGIDYRSPIRCGFNANDYDLIVASDDIEYGSIIHPNVVYMRQVG